MIAKWVATISFTALILVLTKYAWGFPIESDYVPFAMLGLFAIGIFSGAMHSSAKHRR